MKTKASLDKNILDITMKINKEFPELSKFICEIPFNDSDKDGVEIKNLEDYYNSLRALINNYSKTHEGKKNKTDVIDFNFLGYPLYPPSEDIYNKGTKVMELNPSDLSKHKTSNEKKGTLNEKGFDDDMSGDDLDVPGSELDDQQESIGSEDEENNYYSIGGDNHNDLEEDNR